MGIFRRVSYSFLVGLIEVVFEKMVFASRLMSKDKRPLGRLS
jgi:hypothetical protein